MTDVRHNRVPRDRSLRQRPTALAAAAVGVLVLLLPLAGAAAAASATPKKAAGSTAPSITSPDDRTPEVPGGWTGPIAVSFTEANQGSYAISVDCENGYHAGFTHTVPDDGDQFSTSIPPLPQNKGCGVLVTPADDPDNWLALQEFITTNKTFKFNDIASDNDRFFPRVQDDYFDELKISYWLTQPATVTANIVNAAGRTVTTLTARHRYSGGNRLRWDGQTTRGTVPAQGRYTARLAATNQSGDTLHATVKFVLSDLLGVRPGAIGLARAGMTVAQAMATGQFDKNVRYTVPGVCSRVYPLQPKAPLTWDYSVFVKKHRITEVTSNTEAVSLPRGLSYPPTAAQVRRAYDGHVLSGTAGYANNTLFVHQGRRWLAYMFNSYAYNRPLRATDKAGSFSVSVGRRPTGMQYDGC